MNDDNRIFDNAGEQAAREDFLSGMTPTPTNEQLARGIVDSCMFGYAGNEIDKNATANPDVIEASYKWLVERFAAAVAEVRAEMWNQAATHVRTKAEEWREEANRWQQRAEHETGQFQEQSYSYRDSCLSKMSGAIVTAIEFETAAKQVGGKEAE